MQKMTGHWGLAPPPSDAEADGDIDLVDLAATLWRGKAWIALATLAALVLGAWYAFVAAVPVYSATAVVVLNNRENQVVDFDAAIGGLGGDQSTINTELEVIRARDLIGRLVDTMGLVEDPEFNPALLPPPRLSPGRVIDALSRLAGAPEPPPPGPDQIRERVIDNVRQALGVTNLRQSYVFEIAATSQSPAKAAALANTLAEIYIQSQIEVKFQATQTATEWLTTQVADLRGELETAETAVTAFDANALLVSPEALAAQNAQIKLLRDRRDDTRQDAREAEARLSRIAEARRTGDDARLAALVGLTPDSGSDTLDRAADRAARLAEDTRARAGAQIAALDASIAELERTVARQSEDLVQLQQLQREAAANGLLYEYFLSRLKESSVQQGIQQADSRVLSAAVVPRAPVSPRKLRVLALAAILGMIAGGALVLLREARHAAFRSGDELETATGITVMGEVPVVPMKQRARVLKYFVEKPNSTAAEAIRNLRTSVLLSNLDDPPQVIMLTSSVPGEGKTTQSLALSQNLAGLDRRVLLIEGDIRRLTFRQYFNLEQERGLLSVLRGEASIEEGTTRIDEIGVDVMIGEAGAVNAADVFSSARFRSLIDELRGRYDVIIIDTPPVLVVPDARVIGQSCDAILYVVKWNDTVRAQVREGLRMFDTVNLRVSGLVLSQVDQREMRRFGKAGSYGVYGAEYYSN